MGRRILKTILKKIRISKNYGFHKKKSANFGPAVWSAKAKI